MIEICRAKNFSPDYRDNTDRYNDMNKYILLFLPRIHIFLRLYILTCNFIHFE